MSELPTGHGFVYTRKEEGFEWESMAKPRGWSYEAIEWLNFEQSRFLNSDGTRKFIIRHQLNGAEAVFDSGSSLLFLNIKTEALSKLFQPFSS